MGCGFKKSGGRIRINISGQKPSFAVLVVTKLSFTVLCLSIVLPAALSSMDIPVPPWDSVPQSASAAPVISTKFKQQMKSSMSKVSVQSGNVKSKTKSGKQKKAKPASILKESRQHTQQTFDSEKVTKTPFSHPNKKRKQLSSSVDVAAKKPEKSNDSKTFPAAPAESPGPSKKMRLSPQTPETKQSHRKDKKQALREAYLSAVQKKSDIKQHVENGFDKKRAPQMVGGPKPTVKASRGLRAGAESESSQDVDPRFPLHGTIKRLAVEPSKLLSPYQVHCRRPWRVAALVLMAQPCVQAKMAKQLQGAHFRMINEELYTAPSDHALRLFGPSPRPPPWTRSTPARHAPHRTPHPHRDRARE